MRDTVSLVAGTAAVPADDSRDQVGPATTGPSARSRLGLDGLNFLLADVQQGVGPYLAVFLSGARHWGPGPVGLAIAVSSIVSAGCQIPIGFLIDATRRKRTLLSGSALLFGAGALLIALSDGFWPVMAAQGLLGVASAVIPSAVASISLGLAGRRNMARRTSRNQGFNHAGAFCGAILAGVLGRWADQRWIFFSVVVFALLAAATALLIRAGEIDHRVARGGDAEPAAGGQDVDGQDVGDGAARPVGVAALLRRRPVWMLLVSVLLFQAGSAALLPFASQRLVAQHGAAATLALSGCILAMQGTMTLVAWAVGPALARGMGRKPVFLLAFALLPVRALLLAHLSMPLGVVATETLDGVSGGIFAVLVTVIAADATRGTGRFNVMQGSAALAVGLGSSLSNVAGGYAVQRFGNAAGFEALAAVALAGGLLFWALMPETCRNAAG